MVGCVFSLSSLYLHGTERFCYRPTVNRQSQYECFIEPWNWCIVHSRFSWSFWCYSFKKEKSTKLHVFGYWKKKSDTQLHRQSEREKKRQKSTHQQKQPRICFLPIHKFEIASRHFFRFSLFLPFIYSFIRSFVSSTICLCILFCSFFSLFVYFHQVSYIFSIR